MEPIAIVTVLALLQLFLFGFQVAIARGKYGVKAPAISGAPEFERAFRVQQNSTEQIVIFLPALWIFGYFVNPLAGAGIGLIFIIGRFIYRAAYVKDPATRSIGFMTGASAMSILLIGGLIGALISWSHTA